MKKVLIFGRGSLYKKKENFTKDKFNIIGFLDNNVHDEKEVYENTNVPVYNPQNIKKYVEPDTMIVIMSYQYVAMWKQLYELGVEKERILFGVSFPPHTEGEELLFQNGCFSTEDDKVIFALNSGEKIVIENHSQVDSLAKKMLRESYRKKYPIINAIAHMDPQPISRKFGVERGMAIDRYYIENFLEKNKNYIYGDCLEIAENTYTLRYGGDKVNNSYILHVEGWGNAIKGNLETGEGIERERYDCVLITQTLMLIYNYKEAAANIYKMLKAGGTALVTVSGISQISRYDADLWGSYYSFHEQAMKKVFVPLFGEENIELEIYGNCKTAVAMLCGLCREDLTEDDFKEYDQDYPVIIAALLHKKD